MGAALSGALLLDKPPGITSARAVALVKCLLPRGTKIGHTGTLDPLASGLLILLIGRATRLSRYVTGLDKTYTATAHFGAVSDTLDADGQITPLSTAPVPDETTLREATRYLTGDILQTPPMASAVKVKGERLYKAYRRGEIIERDSRPVTVHAFELVSLEAEIATFRISCSSGTYVRTLISDLAESLDTGAYLTALRRTSVGQLNVKAAAEPENLTFKTFEKCIIHSRRVTSHLPVVEIVDEERFGVCNGQRMQASGFSGSFRVELGGELLAIYRDEGAESGSARAEVVLCGL